MQPIEYRPVTIEEARAEMVKPVVPSPDWAKQRASARTEDLALSAAARTWLAALPAAVRPNELAARHPRIVNQLAALWPRPVLADAYFDALLLDERGNRQGFALPVAMELAALKLHYQTQVYPMRTNVWDNPINQR